MCLRAEVTSLSYARLSTFKTKQTAPSAPPAYLQLRTPADRHVTHVLAVGGGGSYSGSGGGGRGRLR